MGQLLETEKKPITDADKVRLGAELATCDRALIELKEEKSIAVRAYRVRINDLEEKTDTLSRQLNDGIVEHSFEVEEVPDDRAQLITILRGDTKELIKTRAMTESEKAASVRRRQPELFEGDDEHDTVPPPPRGIRSGKKKSNGRAKKNGRGA